MSPAENGEYKLKITHRRNLTPESPIDTGVILRSDDVQKTVQEVMDRFIDLSTVVYAPGLIAHELIKQHEASVDLAVTRLGLPAGLVDNETWTIPFNDPLFVAITEAVHASPKWIMANPDLDKK